MRRPNFVLAIALLAGAGAAFAQPATPAKPTGSVAVKPVEAADITTLRVAAARNEAWAQYDLGVALACGHGVERNRAEAAAWFGRAAEQGHALAQSVLGWMYMTGSGVRRDDANALRWLRSAAEQGNTPAQNNLGIIYAQGRGVPVDRAEAEKWFRKAADQGAADAARNLKALLKGNSTTVRPSTQPPIYSG
jgi:TPR repeat protein